MFLSPTTKQFKTVSLPDQIREICGLLAIHWAFDPSHSPHLKIFLCIEEEATGSGCTFESQINTWNPSPILYHPKPHVSIHCHGHTAIPFTSIWTQTFPEFDESVLLSGASRPSAFCNRKPNNRPRCRAWWAGIGSKLLCMVCKVPCQPCCFNEKYGDSSVWFQPSVMSVIRRKERGIGIGTVCVWHGYVLQFLRDGKLKKFMRLLPCQEAINQDLNYTSKSVLLFAFDKVGTFLSCSFNRRHGCNVTVLPEAWRCYGHREKIPPYIHRLNWTIHSETTWSIV